MSDQSIFMTIILVWQTRQLLSMVLASSGRLVTQNGTDQLSRGGCSDKGQAEVNLLARML